MLPRLRQTVGVALVIAVIVAAATPRPVSAVACMEYGYGVLSDGFPSSIGGLSYEYYTLFGAWTLCYSSGWCAFDDSAWASDHSGTGTHYSQVFDATEYGYFEGYSDGDFKLSDGSNDLVWSTNTSGYSDTELVMQDDGNLVVTSGGSLCSGGTTIWSVGT